MLEKRIGAFAKEGAQRKESRGKQGTGQEGGLQRLRIEGCRMFTTSLQQVPPVTWKDCSCTHLSPASMAAQG